MQAFHQRPSTLTMPPAYTARAGEQHAHAASMNTSDGGWGISLRLALPRRTRHWPRRDAPEQGVGTWPMSRHHGGATSGVVASTRDGSADRPSSRSRSRIQYAHRIC